MSRNKDRMGGSQNKNAETPPMNAMQNNSEGFSFVVPTEFVDLPSQGRFYPEGHPLRGETCIEIRQMTAKEEDLLTSRTLLKKGVALDRVIQNIIVDKRIDPDLILVGDRNAIIISARVTGYGPEYNTKIMCPSCGASQRYLFNLNDLKIGDKDELEEWGIVDNQDGTFALTLPKTQVDVVFKLLIGRDEKGFVHASNAERKKKFEDKAVTTHLSKILVSVNGDNSPQARQYLINNLPSIDSRHLRMAHRIATPNIDMTQHFACSECDHEQPLEVPLTADFFWPDR